MSKGPNVVFDTSVSETWRHLPEDYRNQVMDWLLDHGVNIREVERVEVYDGYMICTLYVTDANGYHPPKEPGKKLLTERVHKTIHRPLPVRLTGL